MRTIWYVKVTTVHGEQHFYAGAESQADAFLMAARAGFEGDEVEAVEAANRVGLQPGEWRRAV